MSAAVIPSPFIADASSTVAGKVSLAEQTFAGLKTFLGGMAVTALPTPVAATGSTAATGGTLNAGTHYFYRVSSINSAGETLAFVEVDLLTPGTFGVQANTCTATPRWNFNPGATGYKVYGRTTGAEQLIISVGVAIFAYTDTGALAPAGALPVANSTANMTSTGNIVTTGNISGGALLTSTLGGQVYAGWLNGTYLNDSLRLISGATDGATTIGTIINTYAAYSTLGAKLVSFQTNSVEKAYIDKDGGISFPGIATGANALTLVNGARLLLGGQTISGDATWIYPGNACYAPLVASGANGFQTVGAISGSIKGNVADGGTAIGLKIGNANALSTAGAKICSFYSDNFTSEKAYIDKDGRFFSAGFGTIGQAQYILLGHDGVTSIGMANVNNATNTIRGSIANAANAVVHKLSSQNAMTTAGAKLLSVYSDYGTTEVLSIGKDGDIRVGGIDALPGASVTYRGSIWVVQGAPGAADTAYICLKTAANSYSWMLLATGV